jgi:hypothetical protein
VPFKSSHEPKAVSSAGDGVIVPFGMDWLKPRLAAVGLTGADFAKALGLPKSRVYEMQSGKRRLQPNEIAPAARLLRMSEAELLALIEGRSGTAGKNGGYHDIDIGSIRPLRQGDTPPAPLVIYRTAQGERGRQGDFMLYAVRAGQTDRPEFLRFSGKAFAARILGDENNPAYRPRDLVLVDPDTPSIDGEDCLFTGNVEDPKGSLSVVACLVSSTAKMWITRQYGVKGERELAKSEFPHAWPIVGRYNRR